MPNELWGEGRVVGYSAYEIYVKQQLALFPEVKPATERQWLASSLASGASILMKIVADSDSRSKSVTTNWYRDYKLPEQVGTADYSLLCAANTIVGSFFIGTGGYSAGSSFAHKVISYGNLMKNTSSYPLTDGDVVNSSNYPVESTGDLTEDMQKGLKNYMKIVDGIVIQPSKWKNTGTTPPRDYSKVLLDKSPTVRIHFRGPITDDFELMLTGFSIRAVVVGESGLGGSVTDNTQFNKDGAFLGPGQYPWASKVVFSVPNAYEQYMKYFSYQRKLPSTSSTQTPKGQPVIDMETTDPGTYYSGTHTGFSASSSKVDVDVTKLNVLPEEADVLTVYQRNSELPPALYGSKATTTGSQSIYPLDTVAPGTVKMYTSESDAKTHQSNTPNNYSIYKNTSDNTVYHVKGSGSSSEGVPIARQDSYNANYTHSSAAGSEIAQVVEISTGDIKRRVLSMQNASGTNRTISSPPSSKYATNDDDLYWSAFLDILANDKKIDILGDDIKKFKTLLSTTIASLQNNSENQYLVKISKDGSGNVSITFDLFKEEIIDDPNLHTYVTQTTVGNKIYKDISLRDTSNIDVSLDTPPSENIGYESKYASELLNDGYDSVRDVWKVVDKPYVSWIYLLRALKENKAIDILGQPLRIFRLALTHNRIRDSITNKIRNVFELGNFRDWSVGGSIIARPIASVDPDDLGTDEDPGEHTIYSGTNYIVFTDPVDETKFVRLYISNTEPTGSDIPVGSIGIGW